VESGQAATRDIVMPGRLIARGGPRAGLAVVLGPAFTSIGRGPENDVVLDSPHASRNHARVELEGSGYVLHDLGSKNGVTVNGHRVHDPLPLSQGDVIELPGLTFTFDLSEDTVTVGPAAAARNDVIRVDTVTAEVWVRGESVRVSAKEYLALAHLYQHLGALISKEVLATVVWPEYEGNVSDYNVEQLISRLRRKIEVEPEHPQHLLTVRGLGYRLVI
jgi:pSer/pThr/pTyr-binding forkhead associated (FHA) protein